MATVLLENWNGEPIPGVMSRGEVFSALDWRDMVLASGQAIEQKAARQSRHIAAYDRDAQIALQNIDGHYCSLQSISSEDTVTWSVFGSYSPKFWLYDLLSLTFTLAPRSLDWTIEFWKRLPHPETGTSYGPEADVILTSSNGWCCAIEAKWLNTDIDKKQGRSRDKTQLEMRAKAFTNQLVIAPGPSRYLCATQDDSTFSRYFRIVNGQYEPTSEANNLGIIRAISWEKIEALLVARKETEAAIIASYLRWRLDKLRIATAQGQK